MSQGSKVHDHSKAARPGSMGIPYPAETWRRWEGVGIAVLPCHPVTASFLLYNWPRGVARHCFVWLP